MFDSLLRKYAPHDSRKHRQQKPWIPVWDLKTSGAKSAYTVFSVTSHRHDFIHYFLWK